MTPEETIDRAKLTRRFRGEQLDIPILVELVQMYPHDPRGYLYAGMALLEVKDPMGVSYLERASQIEPRLMTKTCNIIAEFLRSQGQHAKAIQYERNGQASRAKKAPTH